MNWRCKWATYLRMRVTYFSHNFCLNIYQALGTSFCMVRWSFFFAVETLQLWLTRRIPYKHKTRPICSKRPIAVAAEGKKKLNASHYHFVIEQKLEQTLNSIHSCSARCNKRNYATIMLIKCYRAKCSAVLHERLQFLMTNRNEINKK